MAQTTAMSIGPWYRSLNANQWKTLLASNLGWTFDGYETFALILAVGVAVIGSVRVRGLIRNSNSTGTA